MEQFTILQYTPHSTHVSILHTIRLIFCSHISKWNSSLFSNILHTPHTSQFYTPYASSSAPTSANEQFTITILHTRLNFTHHTPHLLLPHQQMNSSLFSTILHTPNTSQFHTPYASSSAPLLPRQQIKYTPHSTHVSIFQLLHFTATLHTCLQDTACTYVHVHQHSSRCTKNSE